MDIMLVTRRQNLKKCKLFCVCDASNHRITFKADELDSLKKICILPENVIFHE